MEVRGGPREKGTAAELEGRAEAVRRFNRFYTRRIGVLEEGLLRSPFSLAEARVLYELAHREQPAATELGAELGLDPGYLSRILRGFARRGLLRKEPSETDRRRSLLSLTGQGRRAFAALDTRSREQVRGMLLRLPEGGQRSLLEAMRTIEGLLEGSREARTPFVLRPPEPGDLGFVVHRHGVLYAREYGYDAEFEALVADIVARFVREHDPKRERCWIAEREGEVVGSVFLVQKSKTVAKLRLLYVEPSARGLGIGARLVGECVRFARRTGYRKVTLWTQNDLFAARHLYEKAGFRKVREEPHRSFGRDLVAETWELAL
jgi:DNA-binding MarR family transcriptional regulator/N-acetylglutamate synthase-like GNAT family acetyltransferase